MTVRRISLQSIRTQVGRGAAHFARISHHREKRPANKKTVPTFMDR